MYYRILIAIALLGHSLSACSNEGLTIMYDQTFEHVREIAKDEGKAFCIVLSRPDCSPCVTYIERIGEKYKHLGAKAVFNVVDVLLPENRWYQHWGCIIDFPTTCVFSSKGEFIAIVSGAAEIAMQCLESALEGDTKCADYFYRRNYSVIDEDYRMLLSTLLSCKIDLDNGIDIGHTIDACLRNTHFPYPIYLKYLNEVTQGRREEAVFWAHRLQEFDDVLFYQVYSDLYQQTRYIINPDYRPEDSGILTVESRVRLEDCMVNQPKLFSVTLTNTGKMPLMIHSINVGCTCLRVLGQRQFVVGAGESKSLDFEFTAESRGEFQRLITLFSDATNSIEYVLVHAKAK